MLTGTLRTDDLRGRVMTGVGGAPDWADSDAAAVRAASIDRLAPRPREDASIAFGVALNDEESYADAPASDDQLGPPNTPWMRWEGATRAIKILDRVE